MKWCLTLVVYLVCSTLKFGLAHNYDYQVNLCGPEEHVYMEGLGEKASLAISMNNSDATTTNVPCSLFINAPDSHVIHLQFYERNLELRGPMSIQGVPPCNLEIYFSGNYNTPAYIRNLCSGINLPPLDLLAPNIKLVWTPPKYGVDYYTNMRHLILTAVGKGEVCKQQGQHICMKIGLEPLCISGHLFCDGHQNCPKGATTSDEDEEDCKNLFSRNHWKRIASTWAKIHNSVSANNKFMDNLSDEIQNIPFNDIISWMDRSNNVEVSTKPVKEIKIASTFSITQSPYWPWGYLFLPLLLCGFLFIICIFWECWITRRKHQRESPPNNTQTTILLVNGYDDVPQLQQPPPDYNDLDLPPSYATLFPLLNNNKLLEDTRINRSAEAIPMGSINELNSLGGESSSSATNS